jgi:hypothetical protein
MGSHPHLLVVHALPTNKAIMTESQQYNSCIRNGGNGILKYAGPETTGSSPTTGVTVLWACNPLGEIQTTGKKHKEVR